MKYEKYLRKLEVMFLELLKDIEQKCYNKAISSFWFTVELLLRLIIFKVKGATFERSGKLINVMNKYVIKPFFPDLADVINKLNRLYIYRRNADHAQ